MLARARAHGVPVAALVGAAEHAMRQVQAGVDLIVAQGAKPAAIAARYPRWCCCPR